MSIAVADTHVIIWYLNGSGKLSEKASRTFQKALARGGDIYISTITLIEITYLVEKGRISQEAENRLFGALDDPETYIKVISLDRDIAREIRNIPRDIVPDMPDRIIAATARYLNLPLITRDHNIRAANIKTIW